jgi:hypothetical protein
METEGATDGSTEDVWWNLDYCARIVLIVPADRVSRNLPGFPLLVKIESLEGFALARPDLSDLVFVDTATGQRLPHEVDRFEPDAGRLLAWVRAPLRTVGTRISLYLCNEAAGAGDDPAAVWEEYGGVWHMNADDNGRVPDSTGHGNHGQIVGGVAGTDGPVGGALSFDGVDDGIDIRDHDALTWDTSGTVSAWASAGRFQTNIGPLVTKAISNGSSIEFNSYYLRASHSELYFQARNTDQGAELFATPEWTQTGIWHFVVGTYDGARLRLYFDGALVAEREQQGSVLDPGFPLHIGSWGQAEEDRWWAGKIDEVRVSRAARDDVWIATEWANQIAPSQFVQVMPVQLRP